MNIITIRMAVTCPTGAVETENPVRAEPLTLIGWAGQRQKSRYKILSLPQCIKDKKSWFSGLTVPLITGFKGF